MIKPEEGKDGMKIAILGAGAMGMLFGSYLSQHNQVWLIDIDEKRIEKINADGVVVCEKNGEDRIYRPLAAASAAGLGTMDLVLVFVKSMFTVSALENNRSLIGPDTYLMTLQNGAGHEAKLLQFADEGHVIIGSTQHNSSVIANGHVNHGGSGQTSIGLLNGHSNEIQPIAENFTACGLDCCISINYINLLAVQMLLGATQGMQPLVSFAKGKKDPALCKLYLRFARIFSVVIVAAIFSICVFGTDWVVSGFISPGDTHIYAQARRALLIFSGSLIPVGFNIVSIGYFSAMELPKYSQFLSLFRGSVGITLIGILLAALLGETGIWLAPAVSEGVSAAITLRLFARGKAKAGLVC